MLLLISIFGACLGSFLNVCIWRIPRGESLARPPSHCGNCGERLSWRDIIPVISYFCRKGRCAHCSATIPLYNVIVELATALILLLLFNRHGLSLDFLIAASLYSLLMVIALIDFHWLGIPNGLVVLLLFFVLLDAAISQKEMWPANVSGFAAGGMLLWLSGAIGKRLLKRECMGMGDIKLAAVLGFHFGWFPILLIIWMACFIGSVYAFFGLATGRLTGTSKIPLGFFIDISAIAFLALLPPGESLL